MTKEQRKQLIPFIMGSPLCEIDYDFDSDQPRHYEVINGYDITYDKGKYFTVYPDGSLFIEPDKTPDQLDEILVKIATEHLKEFQGLMAELTNNKGDKDD